MFGRNYTILPIKNKIVMILENGHDLPSQMYVRLKSFFAI